MWAIELGSTQVYHHVLFLLNGIHMVHKKNVKAREIEKGKRLVIVFDKDKD
jgi:hypothetical protein